MLVTILAEEAHNLIQCSLEAICTWMKYYCWTERGEERGREREKLSVRSELGTGANLQVSARLDGLSDTASL